MIWNIYKTSPVLMILINNIDMISWDQPLCHVNCRQVNCPDDFAGFHLIDQHSVWRSNWKAQPASFFCKPKSHKFDEKIMTTFTNTTEQPTTWQTFQSCRIFSPLLHILAAILANHHRNERKSWHWPSV